MSLKYVGVQRVTPLFIQSMSTRFSNYAGIHLITSTALGVSSRTWPAANRAIYVPFAIPFAYPTARVWWVNGATAAGTVDFGIYDLAGNLLHSTAVDNGGTAITQAGINAPQYVAANWPLLPGSYYMGLVASSASATFFAGGENASNPREMGAKQQASASPLPSTWTPATYVSNYYPLCGITKTASGY